MVRKVEPGSSSSNDQCPLHPFSFLHIFSFLYSNILKESTFWVSATQLVSNICFPVSNSWLKYIHFQMSLSPEILPKGKSLRRGWQGFFSIFVSNKSWELLSDDDEKIIASSSPWDHCSVKMINFIQTWQPSGQYRMFINNVSILFNSCKSLQDRNIKYINKISLIGECF